MLSVVLCGTARPKHWLFSHGGVFPHPHHYHHQHHDTGRRRLLRVSDHRVSSAGGGRGRPRGEGSWNVAWDVRPARWLHRPDSAWLLYGVCACLAQVEFWLAGYGQDALVDGDEIEREVVVPASNAGGGDSVAGWGAKDDKSADYKVTGVLADGRCLFRAIAHGACLRSGEEAPDEDRQRELADELRARVVGELLKRREEVEWFIEGDFDAYVKRIEQPYVWGGEPELLMASHVLKTMISVFMLNRTSGKLVKIADYGEEYRKDKVDPIHVLFHGYGHYDIVESLDERYQTVNL